MNPELKIYKYVLEHSFRQTLTLPDHVKILSTIEQHGEVVIYCLVNPEEVPTAEYEIQVVQTGEACGDVYNTTFLGTIQFANGIVYHVFYKRK